MHSTAHTRPARNGLGRPARRFRSPVRIVDNPTGRGWRLYVAGYRWHHGLFGAGLVGFGALLVLVGFILAISDKKDWPWPLIDRY
jgi:hypothetical protein